MIIGKIVGSIVSTRKHDKLVGSKLMIVETISSMNNGTKQIVAVDYIGAGIGENVLVAIGSSARLACEKENAPIDAAIVGIIDNDCNNFG